MSSASIWTRLGNWLRWSHGTKPESAGGSGEAQLASGSDGLTVTSETSESLEPAVSSANLEPSSRWHRRDQALQRLQEGYEQVLDLLTSVRQHLDTHDEHTRQMSESITRLAGSLGELPSLSNRQAELLDGISQQLEKQRTHQEQLSSVMEQWPESARLQTESLRDLREELRGGHQAQTEVASSLQAVGQAVGHLTEQAHSGTKLIESLEREIGNKQSQIAEALESQGKRLIQLVWAALALSGLAAAGALVAVLLQFRSGT